MSLSQSYMLKSKKLCNVVRSYGLRVLVVGKKKKCMPVPEAGTDNGRNFLHLTPGILLSARQLQVRERLILFCDISCIGHFHVKVVRLLKHRRTRNRTDWQTGK